MPKKRLMGSPIQQLRQMLATARPWVLVAIILAAGLVLYFATQGVRYAHASWSNAEAREEVDRSKGVTGPQVETPAEQEARVATKQLRLVNLRRLFEYSTTDTLISVVSDTAREAGLELAALTVEEVTIESLGTLQYDVRHISVIIEGPTDNVQVFLGALYDRVPVVAASNARIVDLDSDPSTQLQLEFYLSPEPKSDVSEETAG